MTDTQTKPVELHRDELEELGIDLPSEPYWEAYRIDDDTIRFLIVDQDGGCTVDPPNEDHSGENAWEWIEFRDGQERDEWRLENSVCKHCGDALIWDDAWVDESTDGDVCGQRFEAGDLPHEPTMAPTDILIERYEHGQVCYAPIGESSQVDRQWDVAYGVAVIRFLKPDDLSPGNLDRADALMEFARGICEEYTSWCNGDIYGIVTYQRVVAPHSPTLITNEWYETDACWGFLGHEYAVEALTDGHF